MTKLRDALVRVLDQQEDALVNAPQLAAGGSEKRAGALLLIKWKFEVGAQITSIVRHQRPAAAP